MHNQNQNIYNNKSKKTYIDILSLLPAKNTRKTLKTEMLRVDHAGEFGAVHIYRGQISVLKNISSKQEIVSKIQHMAEQEVVHLEKFNQILPQRHIRPSLLSPLWQLGGFTMGVVTAFISEKSAMACTEAVETVIDKHYDNQIKYFFTDNVADEILPDLKQFQQDELHHKQEAIDSDSPDAPLYKTSKFLIESLCHIAIKLAHKI